MGGRNYSDDLYRARVATRDATGTPTFAFNAGPDAVKLAMDAGVIPDDPNVLAASKANKVHPSLDPHGVVFRECRDSDVHPTAVPVAILLDVTGSMASVPRIVQEKLPALMGLLIRKGYLEHPAIQIVALGDASSNPRPDKYPLQVGQFESDISIEDDLTNLILEGGGGGQNTESYELALHFEDKHVVTDHWEKRGQRGYMFIIGDENPYPNLSAAQVTNIIGTKLSEPRSADQIVESLRERWEIFFINPNNTSNFKASWLAKRWESLLPQRCIYLEDPATICECIAAQIGVLEETATDVTGDLVDAGMDRTAALSLSKALVPAGASAKGSVQKVASSGAASGVKAF